MKRYSTSRITAIGLYLMLSLWPLMAIGIWLYASPVYSISETLSPAGAKALFANLIVLAIGSIAQTAMLLTRLGGLIVGVRILAAVGVVLVFAGLAWGILAAAMYLLAALFLIPVYREAIRS